MDVSIAEARDRLAELISSVEEGASVIITKDGKPVAQLTPAPPEVRVVEFDKQRDAIQLLPGWDTPVDLDRFLDGSL